MIARFIRFFPAYTAELVLKMPSHRFFSLNKQIGVLQAEEEIVGLATTHSAEPGKRISELVKRTGQAHRMNKGATQFVKNTPIVAAFEQQSGEIMQFREQQRAAAEKLKAEYNAKKQSGAAPGGGFAELLRQREEAAAAAASSTPVVTPNPPAGLIPAAHDGSE